MDNSKEELKVNGSYNGHVHAEVRKRTSEILLKIIKFEEEFNPCDNTRYKEHMHHLQERITLIAVRSNYGLLNWHNERADYYWLYNEIDTYLTKITADDAMRSRDLRIRDENKKV